MSNTNPHEKLQDLLKDFDVAMLTTRTAEGELRARPMAVADVEESGTVWFLTQRGSHKMDEILRDDQTNVSMQSSMKFVSLSGTITPVEDRAKLEEVWNEAWKHWFPEGKNDPALVLLRFDGETGEYWDNSGTSGLKYLIEAGRAYLAGERPDVADDPKIHGKVSLSK